MELRHLELFVAVAEEQQFTRAAHRCHIGQSALSTAIRTLEGNLGTPLFVRTTRRVDLTQAGHALLPEARRTLAAAQAARTAVEGAGAVVRGSLAVGGITTTGILDQPARLAEFSAIHPAVQIRYVHDASTPLIDAVVGGTLDLAFVSIPDRHLSGLEITTVAEGRLAFLCRRDHPLAGRGEVTLEMLTDEDFVGAPPGTVGYEVVQRAFSAEQLQRRVPYNVNDVDSMIDFVSSGLGVTIVQDALTRGRPELHAALLAHPKATWALGVVTLPAERLSLAARAFLELLDLGRHADGGAEATLAEG